MGVLLSQIFLDLSRSVCSVDQRTFTARYKIQPRRNRKGKIRISMIWLPGLLIFQFTFPLVDRWSTLYDKYRGM